MAGARVDARYTACTFEQWQEWQLPEEKNKPAKQITRIVDEWSELRPLLPLLKEIHEDPKIAAGMALQAYRTLNNQGLQLAVAPAAESSQTEQDPFNQEF